MGSRRVQYVPTCGQWKVTWSLSCVGWLQMQDGLLAFLMWCSHCFGGPLLVLVHMYAARACFPESVRCFP